MNQIQETKLLPIWVLTLMVITLTGCTEKNTEVSSTPILTTKPVETISEPTPINEKKLAEPPLVEFETEPVTSLITQEISREVPTQMVPKSAVTPEATLTSVEQKPRGRRSRAS